MSLLSFSILCPCASMFVVVEMVDTVRIPPWQFQRQLNDAIAEELNKKLANKVRGGGASDSDHTGHTFNNMALYLNNFVFV